MSIFWLTPPTVGAVEHLELLHIADGSVKYYKHYGKLLGSFLKVRVTTTLWPNDSAPRYLSYVK